MTQSLEQGANSLPAAAKAKGWLMQSEMSHHKYHKPGGKQICVFSLKTQTVQWKQHVHSGTRQTFDREIFQVKGNLIMERFGVGILLQWHGECRYKPWHHLDALASERMGPEVNVVLDDAVMIHSIRSRPMNQSHLPSRRHSKHEQLLLHTDAGWPSQSPNQVKARTHILNIYDKVNGFVEMIKLWERRREDEGVNRFATARRP